PPRRVGEAARDNCDRRGVSYRGSLVARSRSEMKWLSDDKLDHLRTVVTNPDFSSTKYTFIKELGRGGMGAVYLAEDRELNRLVAIKVLNTPEVTEDLHDRM